MTNRIDHVAEAERLLTLNSPDAETRAQVHATLALVEQQRIANLIALDEYADTALFGEDGAFLPDIAAALGIEVAP